MTLRSVDDTSPARRWIVPAFLRRTLRRRGLALPLGILGILVLAALLGPILWQHDPLEMDFGAPLDPPSLAHPMGTDGNGRDVLSRFFYGARISLLAGAIVVVAGFIIGGGAGLLAGMSGRLVDNIIMRVMDALAAFPPLILAMAVTVGLGVGLPSATLGVMLSSVPFYARLIRADVVRLRALPFIEATVAIGASRMRITLRHLVPHTASTMLIQAAAVFGYAILSLAGLGFIGLGAQVPEPEWGAMITDGMQYALTGQWWVALFPGIGVLLAVIGANMLADRIRDRLDPRGQRFGMP